MMDAHTPKTEMELRGAWPCPVCGAPAGVIDSRPSDGLGFHSVRRRRRCTANSSHRFTTHEIIESEIDGVFGPTLVLAEAQALAVEAQALATQLISVLTPKQQEKANGT